MTPAWANETPYMFEPGDMGEYVPVQVGVRADNGEPVYGWKRVKPGIYTGGYNVDGTPTRAMQP